jgi:hypothetical protein
MIQFQLKYCHIAAVVLYEQYITMNDCFTTQGDTKPKVTISHP